MNGEKETEGEMVILFKNEQRWPLLELGQMKTGLRRKVLLLSHLRCANDLAML